MPLSSARGGSSGIFSTGGGGVGGGSGGGVGGGTTGGLISSPLSVGTGILVNL